MVYEKAELFYEHAEGMGLTTRWRLRNAIARNRARLIADGVIEARPEHKQLRILKPQVLLALGAPKRDPWQKKTARRDHTERLDIV